MVLGENCDCRRALNFSLMHKVGSDVGLVAAIAFSFHSVALPCKKSKRAREQKRVKVNKTLLPATPPLPPPYKPQVLAKLRISQDRRGTRPTHRPQPWSMHTMCCRESKETKTKECAR